MIKQTDINWIKKNWNKIPSKFKSDTKPNRYSQDLEGINADESYVVLLLDRQKPSVEPSYDFDEERIGVTRTGKIIWGFDSGCSCPAPWDDSYPDCYEVSKSWKEFEINTKEFDREWDTECLENLKEIKKEVLGK